MNNVMNIPDEVMNKIRKLLRMGESQNENEAKLALAHAQKIALEHEIDIQSINPWVEKQVETIEKSEDVFLGGRKPVTTTYIGWILKSHFNVQIIYFTQRNNSRMVFVGTKTDIEMATYVHHFLSKTFMELWRQYQNKTNCNTRMRASYLYGMYRGFDQKLTEEKQQAEDEKFAAIESEKGTVETDQIKQNYSLMVISKKEKIAKAVSEFFPKLRNVGVHRFHQRTDVINDGIQTGKKISITKGLGGNQKFIE